MKAILSLCWSGHCDLNWSEGFLVTYLNYRSYPKVLKLFSGARKLAVSVVDLRQNFLPPSVQVFQVSFESLRWLFSGSFGDQVLRGVVDVLETCCPFSQLAPHVLTTRTNWRTIIRIIPQHVIKHRYRKKCHREKTSFMSNGKLNCASNLSSAETINSQLKLAVFYRTTTVHTFLTSKAVVPC